MSDPVDGYPFGTRGRVLIVDDDEDLRVTLGDALEQERFAVTGVADGEAALAHLLDSHKPPSVIVLDLVLPKKSGYDLLRILKNSMTLMDVPVVVFSANIQSPPQGAVAWVRKPVKPAELVRIIEQYADGSTLTRR